ncbi:MAG TPA: hypothetical protein VGV15_11915 [Terriglobales bacterium]|nr:hypothetical protein [Terriglobales bacterium]
MRQRTCRRTQALAHTLLALVLAFSLGVAQTAAQQSQAGSAPGSGQSTATQSQQNPARDHAASNREQKISPAQAEELFRSVDEILQFASKDTLFPIKHEVKRKLVNREEVEAFVAKHTTEDEDAKRLRRSELVLKKFGLLPRDFDLSKFLVALLKEQVAGYYDPKAKTVNLLDWVGPEQQKPVLAHELTHALQDQSFDLEKFMKPGDVDLNDKETVTQSDIDNDEISTARQAVVEGQAMVVLVDYMLAPLGQSIKDSPELVNTLKQGMLAATADAPQFQNAPLYLREALTFPYRYGIDFIAELLLKSGKEKVFAGLFQDPPKSTRQIMEPKTYISGERLEPMPLPDFKEAFKNYERFDVGSVGELDVAVLLDQYAGADVSHALYPHWRGGYYYAARPKGDPAAPLAILYVSRWSSAEKAADFAKIYGASLAKRYAHAARDVAQSENRASRLPLNAANPGKHTWLTEEGTVVVEQQADTVLVTESLDQITSDRLEEEVFGAAMATGR